MILIAQIDKGIIKKGMKFVYLSETDEEIHCWSVDLAMHFKISKKALKEIFKNKKIQI
jgi:hypothetical protein